MKGQESAKRHLYQTFLEGQRTCSGDNQAHHVSFPAHRYHCNTGAALGSSSMLHPFPVAARLHQVHLSPTLPPPSTGKAHISQATSSDPLHPIFQWSTPYPACQRSSLMGEEPYGSQGRGEKGAQRQSEPPPPYLKEHLAVQQGPLLPSTIITPLTTRRGEGVTPY